MVQGILAHVRKEVSKSQRHITDTACHRVSPRGGGTGRGRAPIRANVRYGDSWGYRPIL